MVLIGLQIPLGKFYLGWARYGRPKCPFNAYYGYFRKTALCGTHLINMGRVFQMHSFPSVMHILSIYHFRKTMYQKQTKFFIIRDPTPPRGSALHVGFGKWAFWTLTISLALLGGMEENILRSPNNSNDKIAPFREIEANRLSKIKNIKGAKIPGLNSIHTIWLLLSILPFLHTVIMPSAESRRPWWVGLSIAHLSLLFFISDYPIMKGKQFFQIGIFYPPCNRSSFKLDIPLFWKTPTQRN